MSQNHDHHDRLDVLGSLRARRDAAPSEGAVPEGAARTVRPARSQDAAAIGAIHARTMAVSLAAGLDVEELDADLAAALDPAEMGRGWDAAITAPPSPEHAVLVALDGDRVVGFTALAPATRREHARPVGEAHPGRRDLAAPADTPRVEILALEVPAGDGRQGHGSRLMSACADLAREQGAGVLQTWAVQGEESRARFLDSCGFAPAGLRRESETPGGRLVELCWEAAL